MTTDIDKITMDVNKIDNGNMWFVLKLNEDTFFEGIIHMQDATTIINKLSYIRQNGDNNLAMSYSTFLLVPCQGHYYSGEINIGKNLISINIITSPNFINEIHLIKYDYRYLDSILEILTDKIMNKI